MRRHAFFDHSAAFNVLLMVECCHHHLKFIPQEDCLLVEVSVGLFKDVLTESIEHNWSHGSGASAAVPWRFDRPEDAQVGANILYGVNTEASCVSQLGSVEFIT